MHADIHPLSVLWQASMFIVAVVCRGCRGAKLPFLSLLLAPDKWVKF